MPRISHLLQGQNASNYCLRLTKCKLNGIHLQYLENKHPHGRQMTKPWVGSFLMTHPFTLKQIDNQINFYYHFTSRINYWFEESEMVLHVVLCMQCHAGLPHVILTSPVINSFRLGASSFQFYTKWNAGLLMIQHAGVLFERNELLKTFFFFKSKKVIKMIIST